MQKDLRLRRDVNCHAFFIMDENLKNIPLFPLQIVVLPDSVIHLHIFESRYKSLIHECEIGENCFGINLVLGGRVHRVGCSVKLLEIIKRYNDGRLDIRVQGIKQYRLHQYHKETTPYFMGRIEYIEDDIDSNKIDLKPIAKKLFDEIIGRIYSGKETPETSIVQDELLSYRLAEFSGLDLFQKQIILETVREDDRLQLLIVHYEKVLEKIRIAEELNSIIKIDTNRWN